MGANNNCNKYQRQAVWELWDGKSAITNRPLKLNHVQIDHIISEHHGGKHEYANFAPISASDNHEKAERNMEEFLYDRDYPDYKERTQKIIETAKKLATKIEKRVLELQNHANEQELTAIFSTDDKIEEFAHKCTSKKKPYNIFDVVFNLLRDYIKNGWTYVKTTCQQIYGISERSVRAKLASIKIEIDGGLKSIYNPEYEGKPN